MTDEATDDVYLRYRDALRRGHRAAESGKPNAALLAYAEAAAAAPDRTVPYVAMGAIHLRAGRAGQALDAFDAALRRSPRDEAALRGRADALITDGRRTAAATALDVLAAACESDGRLVEAMVAARRGLELAESRQRRRALADLASLVRMATFEDAPDEALHAAAELEETERVLGAMAEERAEPVPAEVVTALADLERADLARQSGDAEVARTVYLGAAHALSAAGLRDAALDACLGALAVAPGDPDLHVTLAEIYARAGWSAQLAAKAEVLERFLALAPAEGARARLAEIVASAAD